MAEERAWLRVRSDTHLDGAREGAFLRLRSVVMALEGADGWVSAEGTWDFVERPRGLDAVIVVVFRSTSAGPEVLLRSGLRVPAALGVPGAPHGPGRHPAKFIEELIAGLVEPSDVGPDALRERARIEVEEESGLVVSRDSILPLGAPLWATPGLLAEQLHFFACDASSARSVAVRGDGSPFEALATITWLPLAVAIARIESGQGGVGDLRAELGLRRLAARLALP
jgi:ADP-ribose pyrophosphatase